MPGGSLKPQLSGWRSEAGGVSLTAVSLFVKLFLKPDVHRGFADGCFGSLREPTPCAVDKGGANGDLSLKKGEG